MFSQAKFYLRPSETAALVFSIVVNLILMAVVFGPYLDFTPPAQASITDRSNSAEFSSQRFELRGASAAAIP